MNDRMADGFGFGDAATYVAGLYAQGGPDIRFWRILHDLGQLSDERLAELIEEDGRHRIGRGLSVRMERYIEAVPNLLSRCVPADAAIDMTLRSMCGSARFDDTTVEKLIERYPQVQALIRVAARINNAMWSTCDVREDFPEKQRELPQDFGRPTETGEPRYELRRPLGSGAFGQVYLAVDRLLSERDQPALVAIKVLNSQKRTKWSRERLIEEASKARRVDHPNVVRVLDRGVSQDDEDFIAYELVTGGDLNQWLRAQGGQAEPRKAAALMASVARGVQAAHSAGLVHCDLNPGNIILAHDGQPKVADFGVAIRADETRQRELRSRETGKPIGSKLYISPEQYRCEESSLTVPSDVYAIGGILFTLLTGAFPNGDDLDQIAETHHPSRGRPSPPSLRSLLPAIDPDLESICRRALEPRPERRYNSAGAFADDLEAYLRSEPIVWTQPSPMRIARLWVRRKPALAAITLLLMVSIIALGGLSLSENQRRHTETLRALQAEQAREAEAFRAELERVRAEEQALRNANARAIAESVRTRLEQSHSAEPTSRFLTALWNVEHLFHRDVLGASHDGMQGFAALRKQTVEEILARVEQAGRIDDLEAMLWHTTLAFWLVSSEDAKSIERAESLLAPVESRWSARLPDDDSWLKHIRAIRACAAIRLALLDLSGRGMDLAVARFDQNREALEHYEQWISDHEPASPLHALVLQTLLDLYGVIGEDKSLTLLTARRDELFAR